MNEENKNPQFAIMIAYVNGDGWVVDFKTPSNHDLDPERDYDPEAKMTIPGNARLFTPNGCCWRLRNGKWVCVPC